MVSTEPEFVSENYVLVTVQKMALSLNSYFDRKLLPWDKQKNCEVV